MAACVSAGYLSSSAISHATQEEAIKRAETLKSAESTNDSIKILLDVYNLSDRFNKGEVRSQLITLASASDNDEVISEVIKELANSTDDADELAALMEISENLPEGDNRSNLQTVIEMERADAEAPNIIESQLEEQLADFQKQGYTFSGDPYKEIQNLYKTMVYLGASSQGAMYYEYIKRLEELIEALPPQDHAIKNLFYTNAAIFYTRKRDYQKAIEFDNKLLEQLNDLKQAYIKQGKNVHDLDYFYYVTYRRMLRNFPGLTPQQIEDAYKMCVQIAEINERAKEEFGSGGLSKSYYYMATGQYALATPELKKALSSPEISNFRRQELLGLLAQALRETGDKNGELEALREYTDLIVKEREERRDNMYKELELRNMANAVLADEYLEQEKQRDENRVMRKTSLTLVYVLALILIFLCPAFLRMRQRVRELESKNNKLRKNIEHIFDDGVPAGTRDLRHQKNRLKG